MADEKNKKKEPINITSLAIGAALGAAMGVAGHGVLPTLGVVTAAYWGARLLFPKGGGK